MRLPWNKTIGTTGIRDEAEDVDSMSIIAVDESPVKISYQLELITIMLCLRLHLPIQVKVIKIGI